MHLSSAFALGRGVAYFALGLVLFGAPAQAQCDVFEETNGIVVMEIETESPKSDWVSETTHAGYTGSSYFRWDGPNLYNQPGSGILRYTFKINDGGNYRFRIHNRHNHGDPSEENDVWARIDGKKWTKTYSNGGGGSQKKWVWDTSFEHNHNNHEPANYDLSPGVHVLEISARSHNFMIDRIHLYKNGHPDGTNKNASQSPCEGDDGFYCVAKQNSAGCIPDIDFSGTPSVSSNDPFWITGSDIINNKGGILLYSYNEADLPFHGGRLCVGAPIERTPVQFSGGTQGSTNCTGRYSMDFNAFIQSGVDPRLVPSATVHTQYWYRDGGDPYKDGLTRGFRFVIEP